MPTRTSARALAQRARKTSIRSNSTGSSAARFKLGRAPFGREFVEHAVDVGVPVVGPEPLGDFDGFVDDDAIRYVDAMAELVRADAQRRPLDRIDAVDLAIEMRRERAIELCAVRVDAA